MKSKLMCVIAILALGTLAVAQATEQSESKTVAKAAAAEVQTFTEPVVINQGSISENDNSLTVIGSTNTLADIASFSSPLGQAYGSITITNTNGTTQKMILVIDNGAGLTYAGMPAYANNAAAVAGGLRSGAFYRTGTNPDVVCVVH